MSESETDEENTDIEDKITQRRYTVHGVGITKGEMTVEYSMIKNGKKMRNWMSFECNRNSDEWNDQARRLMVNNPVFVFPSDREHLAFTQRCANFFGFGKYSVWNGRHSYRTWTLEMWEIRIAEIELDQFPREVGLNTVSTERDDYDYETPEIMLGSLNGERVIWHIGKGHDTIICPWALSIHLPFGNRQYTGMTKKIFGEYGLEPKFHEDGSNVSIWWVSPVNGRSIVQGDQDNFNWLGDRPGTASKD